jgi:hypothetical protein
MTLRSPAIAVLLFPIAVSCSGPRLKHATSDEFASLLREAQQVNSVSWVSYIGASQERAYLEYGTTIAMSSKSRTTVYWTELEGLPPELAARIESGATMPSWWENDVAEPATGSNQPSDD